MINLTPYQDNTLNTVILTTYPNTYTLPKASWSPTSLKEDKLLQLLTTTHSATTTTNTNSIASITVYLLSVDSLQKANSLTDHQHGNQWSPR